LRRAGGADGVTDFAGAGGTAGVLDEIGAVYDHVAHAVPSIKELLPLYRDLLGGVVSSGGISPWGGHLAVIIEYAGGGKIELLEPVRRNAPSIGGFLTASPRGGLHHVTFKVPDIQLALDRVLAAGYHPVGTNLEHESWRETFLHPRETGGVLLQLAQAGPGVPGPLAQPLDELLEEAARLRDRNLRDRKQ
jgi:methylmalonyl-CoA/ethylmalonyl-CoA epimerase